MHEHFAPAVQSDGTRELVHRQVSTSGPIVETVYADWFGRKKQRLVPSPSGSGNIDETWLYNSSGQLWKTTRTGVNPTLYTYDTLGALHRSGLDVNNNGLLDLASTDRITETTYSLFIDGLNRATRQTTTKVYATDNSSTATTTGLRTELLSNLGSNTLSNVTTTDIFGNNTYTTVVVDRTNKKVTTTTDHPDSSNHPVNVAHNGLSVEAQDFAGIRFRSEYDALGRPWKNLDPRTGTTTTAYVSGTSLVSTVTDPGSIVTATYTYDSAGRVSSVRDALNKYAYTSYTNRGELYRTWGDTTYPVEYAYDDQGRRQTMKTYRGGSGWNASTWPSSPGTADTTTWAYHANTGLHTSKTDANNKTVSYTYTAAGQVYQRTWARGVITTYAYSSTTGEQTGITYSDGTPSVTTTYNRLGKTSTVADVTGTRTFTYNLAGTLEQQNEILPSGYFGDRRITRGYDTATGVAGRYNRLGVGPAAAIYSEIDQPYGFDTYGRFNSIGYTAHTYTYQTNSHLIASIAHTSSGWTQTRTYLGNADVVDVMETKFGATTKAKFDYTHDSLYRIITAAKTGEQFNTYGNGTQGLETDYAYDDKSQLSADSTTLGGSSTPLVGRDDYHSYDPIGNRNQVNRSGTTLTFSSNALNQYTSFTGSATHTYDDDGNLTSNGVWNYTWDAENRLVSAETASGVTPAKRLEFKYDYMGRRVRKTYYTWGGGAWVVDTDLKFIHDGWNLMLELNASTLAKVRGHVWGLDFSRLLKNALF